MQKIPLTHGYVTLVDDADFERLSVCKWYYHRGYARYSINSRHKVYLHQLLITPPPGCTIDHKNGDGLDNRRENLRIATFHQNQQNRRKSPLRNGQPTSSRYKGVSFNKKEGKWRAQIGHRRRKIWLGFYENEEDAARAYREAALDLYGEFARV